MRQEVRQRVRQRGAVRQGGAARQDRGPAPLTGEPAPMPAARQNGHAAHARLGLGGKRSLPPERGFEKGGGFFRRPVPKGRTGAYGKGGGGEPPACAAGEMAGRGCGSLTPPVCAARVRGRGAC